METKQHDGPGIFLVEVTEEWSMSTTVLIQAPGKAVAEKLAYDEIDFSSVDATSSGKSALTRKVLSVEELATLALPNETGAAPPFETTAYKAVPYTYSKPDGKYQGWVSEDMDLQRFVEEFAPPEVVHAVRLARMEANNGQLPLLDLAEVTP